MNEEKLEIREAGPRDAVMLAAFAAKAFEQAFGAFNTPEDMQAYLESSFGVDRLRSELQDPSTTFLVAQDGSHWAGYCMMKAGPAPEFVSGNNPTELVRLYVDPAHLGEGYGSQLMHASLRRAHQDGHDVIWLGVWQENRKAVRFYERWGFHIIGSREFRLGSDLQQDYVMERALP